jgi:hypothetical protein
MLVDAPDGAIVPAICSPCSVDLEFYRTYPNFIAEADTQSSDVDPGRVDPWEER